VKTGISLFVFIILENGCILKSGRLLSENLFLAARGGFQGFFRYDDDFLSLPGSYPIDPINLPLSNNLFRANRPADGIHGVFSDSLPGAWGERILAHKAGLLNQHYAPAHLLEALGTGGLGALMYSVAERPPIAIADPSLDFTELAETLREANRYEKAFGQRPLELKYLASGGYSAGGARPKVLVRQGGEYLLAKFGSVHDRNLSENVRLEAAGLELGKRIGLIVPEFRIEMIGKRPVLLVNRFDVTPIGGRRGIVSFRTLLSWDNHPGTMAYANLGEIIRKISVDPRGDLERLFKQMVFNILIINTDDHLQNFSMMYADGWRLSPAYDLVPNLWRDEHLLMVDGKLSGLTVDNAIAEGRRFGLTRKKCLTLLQEVASGFAGWHKVIRHPLMQGRIKERMSSFGLEPRIRNPSRP